MRLKLFLLALIAANFASAEAAPPAGGVPTRIENGVTVRSMAPEKKAAEKLENYPAQNSPRTTPVAPAAAPVNDPEVEEFLEDPETPEPAEKVVMKPIIDKNAKPKKPDAPIESNAGPFKKSRDVGTRETIAKPEPKPEVSGKSLMGDDDISGDLKNLDAIKQNKDRATNAEDGVGESGLPIPRFVALKSGEANARTGPGDSYPIRWVYQRKNLPVEVTAEFKLWRRIKDFDGEQSWVHQALLTSRRSAILLKDATARSEYGSEGERTARFKRGVQVQLVECKQDYCKTQYGNIEGWLKKKDLWGVYPAEVFD